MFDPFLIGKGNKFEEIEISCSIFCDKDDIPDISRIGYIFTIEDKSKLYSEDRFDPLDRRASCRERV